MLVRLFCPELVGENELHCVTINYVRMFSPLIGQMCLGEEQQK